MPLNKPRGTNGGRKSQWRSPTKMMRLPAMYEAEIIELAHLLDSETIPASRKISDQIQQHISAVLLTLRPADRRTAKALFNKLVKRIEESEESLALRQPLLDYPRYTPKTANTPNH